MTPYKAQREVLDAFLKVTGAKDLCFGGDTALALYHYQHRPSFDIDLFTHDSVLFESLRPSHWLHRTMLFDAKNFINDENHIRILERKHNIKLDIIYTYHEGTIDDSFNPNIQIESVETIIAKKILFRRRDNLTRDLIDIAVAIELDDVLYKLIETSSVAAEHLREFKEAVENLDIVTYDIELEIINPYDEFFYIAKRAPEIILNAYDKIVKNINHENQ